MSELFLEETPFWCDCCKRLINLGILDGRLRKVLFYHVISFHMGAWTGNRLLQTFFWLVTQSFLPSQRKDCMTSQKSASKEASQLADRGINVAQYSQLSRKRPPLVQDKVVAYGRWSLTGKINKISLMLD